MNPSPSSFWQSAREWLKTVLIALAIALPIRYFIAEPFIVSGASMDPNFASGQFLIVDRLTYRFDEPQRGDVIVFEYPNNPKLYYIKRIIGLPGEKLSVTDGKISISSDKILGKLVLDETYLAPSHISHDTFSIELGSTEYFVMGDNRLQSSDSRVWGALERHFIVGRPIVRLLPINTFSFLPGTDKK